MQTEVVHEVHETSPASALALAPAAKETPWIDAWIRWERDSKDMIVYDDENDDYNNDEKEDDDEEESVAPTMEFCYTYSIPSPCSSQQEDSKQETENETQEIHLQLQGFPLESEQIWNSTGLTVWPSSDYLCQYLVQHAYWLQSQSCRNILELGSGLGRCGILAHHIQQEQQQAATQRRSSHPTSRRHVYLTDGDTDTLKTMRQNVADNRPSPSNINNADTASMGISCHQLLWGRKLTRQFCKHHGLAGDDTTSSITTRNRQQEQNEEKQESDFDCDDGYDYYDDHDERKSSSPSACQPRRIDLVMGSDLIYVPQVIAPLFETVQVLLHHNKPHGIFLMAHSNRRSGNEVNLEMVWEGAEKAGFEGQVLQQTKDEIYLLAFRWKAHYQQ